MSLPALTPSPPPPSFSFGGYATDDNTPEGVRFWPRALARIIDSVVHIVTSLIVGIGIGIMIAVIAMSTGGNLPAILAKFQQFTFSGLLLSLAGSISYHTLCEGLHGSSLGKLIMGQVVMTTTRKPCGTQAALKRSVAYLLDAMFFGAVGYAKMQDTKMQQRHGDTWAKTVVCKRSQVPSEELRSPGRFLLVLALALAVDGAFLTMGLLTRLL